MTSVFRKLASIQRSPLAWIALAFWLSANTVAAQVVITSITTETNFGTPTTRSVNGEDPATTTWTGERTALTRFTAAGKSYGPGGTGSVVIRRNTATEVFSTSNANQHQVWNYQISNDLGSPPNVEVYGEYFNTMEAVLSQNNINTGVENLFFNVSTDTFTTNVERVDFVFDSSINVTADQAFALFDRGGGGSGGNSGFGIAVITGISGLDPTAFSNPLFVADSDYTGAPGLNTPTLYDNYRYEFSGGPELDFRREVATQHIAGLAIDATDLVSAGTTIYGYSIVAQDVTATTGAQLLDWTNATYFPTNTTGSGDVDMAAFGPTFFEVVPEPSAALPMITIGVLALMRRRRRKA